MTTSIYTLNKIKTNYLKKAALVHGDTYEYDMSTYIDSKTKMKIICSEHGSFPQSPNVHTSQKSGCPECGRDKRSNSMRMPLDEYVSRCNGIHDSKYNYDNIVYKNNSSIIDIICPIHGEFRQEAKAHIEGSGCPKCYYKNKTGRVVKPTDVDANDIHHTYTIILFNEKEQFFKTGITKNIANRMVEYTKKGYLYNIVNIIIDTKYRCYVLEQQLLDKQRRKGNMYKPLIKFGGHTECYNG